MADLPTLIDPALLGRLDRTALAGALRPLWEDAGPLVDRLVGRMVETWDEHLVMAGAAVSSMDDRARADLLRAHPRIGADPAALARSSPLSYREQGGDTVRVPATTAALAEANDRYEERFGFPFVEWVDGRSQEVILGVLEVRLRRARRDELRAGCAALVAIAHDRLAHLRAPS